MPNLITKLVPEVKALWLTALRSGEYPQSNSQLRDKAGFCCLGVLTDQYIKIKGLAWEESCGGFSFRNRSDFTPKEVRIWAGTAGGPVDEDDVLLIVPKEILDKYQILHMEEGPVPVSILNDADVPFSVIADLIEEQL